MRYRLWLIATAAIGFGSQQTQLRTLAASGSSEDSCSVLAPRQSPTPSSRAL